MTYNLFSKDFNVEEMEQWEADKYIEIYKNNEAELKKHKNILEKRKHDLELSYKAIEEKINAENKKILEVLEEFAKRQDDLKSTKTQDKWESLSGNVVIKKPVAKVNKPPKKQEEIIKEHYPEFFVERIEEHFDWANLKKRIIIQDGVAYDKETGEELTGIIDVTITESKTEIK